MNKIFFSKSYYNLVVSCIIILLLYIIIRAITDMSGPISLLDQKIELNPRHLLAYLVRTSLRFVIAIVFAIIFAIIYAVLMAKNKRIRYFLLPLLDIFQSIPVLGYLSFTVTAFIKIAPNNVLGIELAAIFAIFTAQVWNIIFALYQSFITVPRDLYEMAKNFKLSKWQTFWKIEFPFAIPSLVTNIILSMTSSWFYVIAQEVISVGTNSYILPGMGAYIAHALQNTDIHALIYALFAILLVIFIFNEIIFKPLSAFSYRFRYEFNVGATSIQPSWLLSYVMQASLILKIFSPIRYICAVLYDFKINKSIDKYSSIFFLIIESCCWMCVAFASYNTAEIIYGICVNQLTFTDFKTTMLLGAYTAIRVISLLFLSSVIWIPMGIYVGLRPNLVKIIQPITQLITAIPANLYYPLFVTAIIHYKLNPNIWTSGMIVIGSQWFILYNVIGGVQTIPTELLEVAKIFRLKYSDQMLKIIIPAILPFYTTGLITAAGASWNSSIVAEIITWGKDTITATGLGAFIISNTKAGNNPNVALGVIVMVIFVIVINHILWKPLYNYVSIKFRLE